MPEIEVSVETTEHLEILEDCFGERSKTGTRVKIGEGVYAEEGRMELRLAEGIPQIINILIGLGGGFAINMASQWLYDKLRDHDVVRLEIEGREVEVDKENFEIRVREVEQM